MTTEYDEFGELVKIATNLCTISLAVQQCGDFPYVNKIREAVETAQLAVDAKVQLYLHQQAR